MGANGWSCSADSDCPSGYACIINGACGGNGANNATATGQAVCTYMLYDDDYVFYGCYNPGFN